MISIICVANDRAILENNLLASLKTQDVDFELLIVDNTIGQFSSIPKALNNAALRANGEYVMFVHQDVYLLGKSWLKQAEETCRSLGEIGAFGVAGVSEIGEYLGFIIDRGRFWGTPQKLPIAASTLDECLLLLSRDTFQRNKFDEDFAFHSYGADICLRLKAQGMGVIVIPYPICHNSATTPILDAGSLEKDDSMLHGKHQNSFPVIRKTTGKVYSRVSPLTVSSKSSKHSFLLKRIFDSDQQIITEFSHSNSLLDFGVIPKEQGWIKRAKGNMYSVGISNYKPYLIASKKVKAHDGYVFCSFVSLPFKKGVFDTILVKGFLEYSKKTEGIRAIRNAESIAGKKIVIVVPNNGYPLDTAYRYYVSIWFLKEFRQIGFKTHGLHFRVDMPKKTNIVKFLPVLKPILARLFPDLLARDLLCVKYVTRGH
jgi:hypothetical protein